MNETTAQALIDKLAKKAPKALELAGVLALATRIEPELLRQARLTLLPGVDASAEADLWFSSLVQSYSPLALVFAPEVGQILRKELAKHPVRLNEAYALLRQMHQTAPPAIQLEEEVTWLAFSTQPDKAKQIEALLLSALRAMAEDGGKQVARWLLRALPGLPTEVRTLPLARLLEFGAAARLGFRRVLPDEAATKALRPWLPALIPAHLPSVNVGVRLTDAGVEFCDPATPNIHVIQAPQTDPVLIALSWQEGSEEQSDFVQWRSGALRLVPLRARTVELETAWGQRWQLHWAEDSHGMVEPQPPITRTVYALFVGIDKYPSPLRPLLGCVNDVQLMVDFLQEHITQQPFRFASLVLLNEQATRQAVVDGFRQHLQQADADDIVLFYFCGYGSRAPTPAEFAQWEPDGLDETLVCYDSRLSGQWDLADKELSQLIAEVAVGDPHILVTLDACHAGLSTRPVESDGVRRAPPDTRQRPLSSFLVSVDQVAALMQAAGGERRSAGDWYTPPTHNHVLLAACRAEENAMELHLGGEIHGVFSYYLLDGLRRSDGVTTYRELGKRTQALVSARVPSQMPQIEVSVITDLELPFLNGALVPSARYATASFDPTRGWGIHSGAVHGIPPVDGAETTIFALFPFTANLDELSTLRSALGHAEVTQVGPSASRVNMTLNEGNEPDRQAIYKAVVTALPLPPVIVALEGDPVGLDRVRQAMLRAGDNESPSLYVREGEAHGAELFLRAEENRYRIRRAGDAYGLITDTPGFTGESARLIVQRLEHIARWTQILTLSSPNNFIPANAVRITLVQIDASGHEQSLDSTAKLHLAYAYHEGAWQPPAIKIKLTNTFNLRLYCMLFDMTESKSVEPLFGPGVWLEPDEEVWVNNGKAINATIPDPLWQAGVDEIRDTLKLIVSTDESDANLLAQEELPEQLVQTFASVVTGRAKNTLERLMRRVVTRGADRYAQREEGIVYWNTTEVNMTIVRPHWLELEITEENTVDQPNRASALRFVFITRSARHVDTLQATQRVLVDRLLESAIQQSSHAPDLSTTLYELLMPSHLKDELQATKNLLLMLDAGAAQYPWEMLAERDRKTGGIVPLSTKGVLVRSFVRQKGRTDGLSFQAKRALVIGEPQLDPARYPEDAAYSPLPGARAEAEAVATLLEASNYVVTQLLQADATTIIKALFANEYQIIHFAGHGIYKPDAPAQSGMVLGGNLFLTAAEIAQLRVVPEMVFFNCCYLGQINPEITKQANPDQQTPRAWRQLAASVAQALIKSGVSAVVAAGWPVDDKAGRTFADEFYRRLLAGETLGDAGQSARQRTFETYPNTNPWGAYQCYAEPDFTLAKPSLPQLLVANP